MHGPRGAGRRLTILVAAAALTALSGCGTQGSVGAADPPKGGDLPVTERAIAAIALDHLPTNTSTRRPLRDSSSRDLQGTLAVDLRYRGEETVGVGVLSGADFDIEADLDMESECTNCEERTVEGGTLYSGWRDGHPGEDPGSFESWLVLADQVVAASYGGGVVITRDPSTMSKLEVTPAMLEELVLDPRLRLTTSQAALDAGEALEEWEGTEPDQ